MPDSLGPRARNVMLALRDSIIGGQLTEGTTLPSHLRLAAEFGVAVMTVRHALAHLEAVGLLQREHGRGTFVRRRVDSTILVVDDHAASRRLLARHVSALGYRFVEADGPSAALAMLESEPGISLVLSDVRMPSAEAGIAFIRAVRRRWRDLPLAAVTGYADDLRPLLGRPEAPIMVLHKPIRSGQIEDLLALVLRRSSSDRVSHVR